LRNASAFRMLYLWANAFRGFYDRAKLTYIDRGESVSGIDPELRTAEIPLFPLRTVLFCGGNLPLRIFEPRYLDMVSRCLKREQGFGVLLIREGSESRNTPEDPAPRTFTIGTYANIVDFNQLEDGMLGIIASGSHKFRVMRSYLEPNGLLMGEVEFLPEERATQLGTDHASLVDVLKELMKHPMVEHLNLDVDFKDARSVSWRLAELLPLEPEIKQSLLQMNLPRERLAELKRLVNNLAS